MYHLVLNSEICFWGDTLSLSPVSCEVEPLWIVLFFRIVIVGIWRHSQHVELFHVPQTIPEKCLQCV